MKKMIIGATMMLTGMISFAILMAGAIISDWIKDTSFYLEFMITYGLMPTVIGFVVIAFIGFIIVVQNMSEK